MGCTNSKERPRTPPPDAALQNAVSDGDGFWAANGEKRASREATPLKAAADPFQTVDLTNPETAAAASIAEAVAEPPTSPVAAIPEAFTATPAAIPTAVAADAFGAPPTPVLKQDIKQAMPPQADATPKVPAPAAVTAEAPAAPNPSETKADATTTAEAPAPVTEAPAAAATTTEASAPKPSPTKPPAIKPIMPGGRKKSKKTNKKKKGKGKK